MSILRYIKPLMIVSGLLTCTMLFAAADPSGAMLAIFGAPLDGPAAEIVVRNWGVLIGLVGAMLIYGAFRPQVQALVLVVAIVSKLAFAGLVLANMRDLPGGNALIAVGVDLVWVVLFAWCLVTAWRARD
jgi:hypothetical protein